jgi:hypothetical protein
LCDFAPCKGIINHVELAIDFQIQLNILGVLWNGLKDGQQAVINFGAYESVGVTATLCVDFILPAKTSASARTNMAVDTLDTTSILFQSRLTSSNSKKILIIIF